MSSAEATVFAPQNASATFSEEAADALRSDAYDEAAGKEVEASREEAPDSSVNQSKNLESKGLLPKVDWSEDPPKNAPTPEFVHLEKEKVEQTNREMYLQNLLVSTCKLYTPVGKENQQIVALHGEMLKGEFGPQSKKAYAQLVQWLNSEIPKDIAMLRELGISNKVSDSADPNKAYSVGIDARKGPTDKDLMKIEDCLNWIKSVGKRTEDEFKHDITKVIDESNFSDGWRLKPGEKIQDWLPRAGELVNLATSAKACAEIMNRLNIAAGSKIFENELPPGAKVDPPTGKFDLISFAMPEKWNYSSPADKAKVEALSKWVQEARTKLLPLEEDLNNALQNPERLINWGDKELKGLRVILDDRGDVVGLCDKTYKPAAGQRVVDANLQESRYDVVECDGKVQVTQRIQMQKSEWYNYLDIGTKNVGNRSVIIRQFAPDQKVIVQTASGSLVIKAANDLKSHKNWQEGKHYGSKVLTAALDVSMLVTGTAEFAAAYRTLRAGGMIALNLAERQVVREGARAGIGQLRRGALRMAAGSTGILTNAGSSESHLAESIQTLRSFYFLADLSRGVASMPLEWNALRKLPLDKAKAFLRSADAVGLGPAGATAKKWAERAMNGMEVPMVIQAVEEQVQHHTSQPQRVMEAAEALKKAKQNEVRKNAGR